MFRDSVVRIHLFSGSSIVNSLRSWIAHAQKTHMRKKRTHAYAIEPSVDGDFWHLKLRPQSHLFRLICTRIVLIMLVISLWLNRITGALWLVKHILYISPKPQSYLQQFLSVNGRNNLPNTTSFLTFLSITRYVRRKNCTLLETKLNWVFNFKLHSR